LVVEGGTQLIDSPRLQILFDLGSNLLEGQLLAASWLLSRMMQKEFSARIKSLICPGFMANATFPTGGGIFPSSMAPWSPIITRHSSSEAFSASAPNSS